MRMTRASPIPWTDMLLEQGMLGRPGLLPHLHRAPAAGPCEQAAVVQLSTDAALEALQSSRPCSGAMLVLLPLLAADHTPRALGAGGLGTGSGDLLQAPGGGSSAGGKRSWRPPGPG